MSKKGKKGGKKFNVLDVEIGVDDDDFIAKAATS